MSLIAERPVTWSEVIGQPTAVRLLKGLLRNPQFMTRGIILEGSSGIGKTTCAYLMARSLMCTGAAPGCGKCASCVCCDASLAVGRSLAEHPDFKDLDAATHSGVEHARDIIAAAETIPVLGKRRVVLVDEAHESSTPAWDAYLGVLELNDIETVYLFATSEGHRIPGVIQTRCATIPFAALPPEAMVGRLTTLADRHHIPYDLDALKRIAVLARGSLRQAVKLFGLVAAEAINSRLTRKLVDELLDHNADDAALAILTTVYSGTLEEALSLSDPLVARLGAVRTIDTMFAVFAKEAFNPLSSVMKGVKAVKLVTQTFLKWTSVDHLTPDALPLFLLDLYELRTAPVPVRPVISPLLRPTSGTEEAPVPSTSTSPTASKSLSAYEAMELLSRMSN